MFKGVEIYTRFFRYFVNKYIPGGFEMDKKTRIPGSYIMHLNNIRSGY